MANEESYTWDELKTKSRGSSTDMSPAAVALRLAKLSSMHKFARMARKAQQSDSSTTKPEN